MRVPEHVPELGIKGRRVHGRARAAEAAARWGAAARIRSASQHRIVRGVGSTVQDASAAWGGPISIAHCLAGRGPGGVRGLSATSQEPLLVAGREKQLCPGQAVRARWGRMPIKLLQKGDAISVQACQGREGPPGVQTRSHVLRKAGFLERSWVMTGRPEQVHLSEAVSWEGWSGLLMPGRCIASGQPRSRCASALQCNAERVCLRKACVGQRG